MSVKIWLDDVRDAPEGWVHVRSVNDAIMAMTQGKPSHVSLDHDLGDFACDGGDAGRFVDWMAEHNCWPTVGIAVHSANPVGAESMLRTIDRYSPFDVGWGRQRGSWD